GRLIRLEPHIVSDAPWSLDREPEVLRRRLCPVLDHLRLGHPIEGVVDLDCRKAPGVPGQHGVRLDVLRIEVSLPFLVGVSARACREPRSFHVYGSLFALKVISKDRVLLLASAFLVRLVSRWLDRISLLFPIPRKRGAFRCAEITRHACEPG